MKGEENSNFLIIVSPRMCLRTVRECSPPLGNFCQLISLWKTCSLPSDVPLSQNLQDLCFLILQGWPRILSSSIVLFQSMGSKILMEPPPRSRTRILPHAGSTLVPLRNHFPFLPVEKVFIHYREGKRGELTLGFIIQEEESGNSCQG